MCCTSLRNLLCNLKLRRSEARLVKNLKRLRNYNSNIGNFRRSRRYFHGDYGFKKMEFVSWLDDLFEELWKST
ncbi:hypothetical protein GQ457_07G005950 [Hibiscus cannabinus]